MVCSIELNFDAGLEPTLFVGEFFEINSDISSLAAQVLLAAYHTVHLKSLDYHEHNNLYYAVLIP